MLKIDKQKTIHFIGIGGAGMSSLALILLERGYKVSGSDVKDSQICRKLVNKGATIFIGHTTNNMAVDVQLVVLSTAIADTNPELELAIKRNIERWHRSQMLAYLMSNSEQAIAIAGAHGKTTTTAMLTWIMLHCNKSPGYMVGSEIANNNSNGAAGDGQWFVAEADESDGSFLNLPVCHAIITNIEDDHLDYYGTIEKIEQAFVAFVQKIPEDGLIAYWSGDCRVNKVVSGIRAATYSYNIEAEADLRAENLRFSAGLNCFDCFWKGKYLATVSLQIPGRHNVLNALAAITLSLSLGLPADEVVLAINSYRGVKRRFETKHRDQNCWIVDDYAHHPTEIATTLAAASQVKDKRLICVFQPHRYTRTYHLMSEFAKCFQKADLVVLTDIYAASEQPIAGIDGQRLANEVSRFNDEVIYIADWQKLPQTLLSILKPGDLLLTVGAGNIYQVGEIVATSFIEQK